jgi:hypothetical protein
MQVWSVSRIRVWSIVLSIASAFALWWGGLALAEDTTSTGNRVFFRGGAGGLTSDRAGELITDVHTRGNDGSRGYYIGGGAELMLTKDLWGLMNGVALVGEIGLEFKRWSSSSVLNGEALVGNTAPAKVQMTMLTASVAPKVKFRQGTDFQPWVIPAGLDFHVISPTSSQVNYLDIGVQFGGGAEYRVWKELWVGLDSRFHLASNQTNTVNNWLFRVSCGLDRDPVLHNGNRWRS